MKVVTPPVMRNRSSTGAKYDCKQHHYVWLHCFNFFFIIKVKVIFIVNFPMLNIKKMESIFLTGMN